MFLHGDKLWVLSDFVCVFFSFGVLQRFDGVGCFCLGFSGVLCCFGHVGHVVLGFENLFEAVHAVLVFGSDSAT